MKFVLSVVAVVLLCSCAGLYHANSTEKIYSASEVKVDYFEEWGLIRSTGYEVVIKGREKIDSSEFFFKKVCGNLFGQFLSAGQRKVRVTEHDEAGDCQFVRDVQNRQGTFAASYGQFIKSISHNS